MFVRRYLGDSAADSIGSLPADEVPILLARANLSRAYLQDDLRKALTINFVSGR